MGIIGAYLSQPRKDENYLTVAERIANFDEFTIALDTEELKKQGSRCMDCGIPFCHSSCPLGNVIPDFNDAVSKGQWEKAVAYLYQTNSFPEFTGRICPAPCEASCVLSINNDAVSIKQIEKRIVESAYENNWLKPYKAKQSGKKIAIIGSGPAGLAAADKLLQLGHSATVYEREKHPGGLLRYGIPDFKLSKTIVERRINLMIESGAEFICSAEVGKDVKISDLDNNYDAVLFAIGAQKARDLDLPGRNLPGVHLAMEFLSESNRFISGESKSKKIDAKGKKVLIIGGGDTGSDCLGTSIRQGAEKIVQIDITPEPKSKREDQNPWPEYPKTIKTSSSQKEGGQRFWSLQTTAFLGNDKLEAVEVQDVEWYLDNGKWKFKPIEHSKRRMEFDLVFIAAGFLSPTIEGAIAESLIDLSENMHIKANTADFKTSRDKFFAAGDARKGQSLVVWALSEGRDAALSIDQYLKDKSKL